MGDGECDGAGGDVDAGGAVSELMVKAAGQGAVAAADVEGRASAAGAEVCVHQPALGAVELPVATTS
ncbi:hypothetical protein [Streptomyces sp. NPDC060054]|uniref:hypothetical protein n=1 Tax=Streptomyces sp. NPDC060054 TaxID=3347048 RepID=UPI0036BE9F20